MITTNNESERKPQTYDGKLMREGQTGEVAITRRLIAAGCEVEDVSGDREYQPQSGTTA